MSLKKSIEEYNKRFVGETMTLEYEAALKQLNVSPNTTITELEKHFDAISDLRSAFLGTKKKAQNEVRCIKAFIEDIEAIYMVEKTEEFYDELQNKIITIPMRFYNGWEFDYLSFQCMQEGYSPTLHELRNCFLTHEVLESSQFNQVELKEKLEQLSLGIANAEFLNDLKNQLFLLTGKPDNKKPKPNNLKPAIKTKNNPVPNHLTYFELNTSYDNLKSFKSELEHSGYISKNLPLDEFRRVFMCSDDYLSDKLKKQPSKPIDWLVNKSHLGYLLKQLSKIKVINEKEYYKIAENCFVHDGEPISNTVFHGMQLPAINAKKKIDRIALLLVEKKLK